MKIVLAFLFSEIQTQLKKKTDTLQHPFFILISNESLQFQRFFRVPVHQ